MCRQAARQAGGQYGVQSTCRALPAPLTAGHRLLLGAMNAAHPGPPCLPALPLPCRYSFPRLHLPPKAIAAAKAAGKTPDTFYCLQARSPQSPGLAPPACCLIPTVWPGLAADETRPVILCEYAHSMGNSTGNVREYWEAFESHPHLQARLGCLRAHHARLLGCSISFLETARQVGCHRPWQCRAGNAPC